MRAQQASPNTSTSVTQAPLDNIAPSPEFGSWLDTSFDLQFEDMDLVVLPWVGSGYRAQDVRTLVLGESVYDYSKGDQAKRAKLGGRNGVRLRIRDHGIRSNYNEKQSRFVRNFERAYFRKRDVTSHERQDLWTSIVFHNLVLEVLKSPKSRPTDAQYAQGWDRAIELVQLLQADQVIVYGLEQRKVRALKAGPWPAQAAPQDILLPKHWHLRPRCLEVEINGRHVRMLFIRHPSSFFAWRQWGAVLQEFTSLSKLVPQDSGTAPQE